MRDGSKRNQMYLISENSELLFGFSCKAKINLGKWRPNRGDEYLLDMKMAQSPSNITMRKPARFLSHEIYAS
jgi:hypothetical protein